jgi:hypothetical protein
VGAGRIGKTKIKTSWTQTYFLWMFSRKKLFWTPFEKSVYAQLAPFAHKPNTALPRNRGGRGESWGLRKGTKTKIPEWNFIFYESLVKNCF